MVATSAIHAQIAAVWRLESPRIVAALVRRLRDLGLAEELAQDALVAALERWPRDGLPLNPGAWLMTTAKNAALDHLRHQAMAARQHDALAADREALGADIAPDVAEQVAASQEDDIGDELLRLVFAACHPLLGADARVALTLKVVCGLETHEIARAFLQSETTVAQRIVRAKRTLAEARVPFEVPQGAERAPRLASVLEVVYLVFNEGYAASSGEGWTRPDLLNEGLRLARQLVAIAPGEPEVLGLAALLELQASRVAARHGADGLPVLLDQQDRSRWDRLLIRRGLALLAAAGERARVLGRAEGSYALQAAVAAEHARAASAEDTDWPAIVAAYERLEAAWPSPVVRLNRAVAMSRVPGADVGRALALVEQVAADPQMAGYPWLPSVRGDLLERLGQTGPAREAFAEAARRAGNAVDRQLMERRAAALQVPGAEG
jgi:RNA polymerase sigma factor (sigma-70 family)